MSSRAAVTFDGKGEVVACELRPSAQETRRIWRAIMLAPRLEVCQALLSGESVPLEQLDPEWVARFGRRTP